MKARITWAKEMVVDKLMKVFPNISRIVDSNRTWEPKDAPLICVSSDFPVRYERESGGIEKAIHLISFDIYLKRGEGFRDASDTDLLAEQVKKEFMKDPFLRGLVSKCHLLEMMCQQMNAENVVRLVQGTLEIEYTVEPEEEEINIPDNWSLNARRADGNY